MHAASPEQWYVFYCSSRAEKKVEGLLRRAGYTVYLPLLATLRQWSDRKKWVDVPLLPGYLFVWAPETQIGAICATPGVVGVLRLAGRPGYLRAEEVETLKRLIASGYSLEMLPQEILPGKTVLVDDGPLRGLKGICMGEAGNRYFYVWIETLDQIVKAKIPAGALRTV